MKKRKKWWLSWHTFLVTRNCITSRHLDAEMFGTSKQVRIPNRIKIGMFAFYLPRSPFIPSLHWKHFVMPYDVHSALKEMCCYITPLGKSNSCMFHDELPHVHITLVPLSYYAVQCSYLLGVFSHVSWEFPIAQNSSRIACRYEVFLLCALAHAVSKMMDNWNTCHTAYMHMASLRCELVCVCAGCQMRKNTCHNDCMHMASLL